MQVLKKLSFFCLVIVLTVVLSNNTEAARYPVPITSDSRIKTLVYNENEVFQLKFHYGYQSFIEFSDNEEIEIISIGEAFPWRLTPTGKRLFVRPLEIGAHTNMTIITTRRVYQFDISSGEYDGRADEELVYAVRFVYPNESITASVLSKITKEAQKENIRENIVVNEINEQKNKVLNFDYSMVGEGIDITPVKVYDDGFSTYFQFSDENLIIPSINIVDINGNETPIDYRIEGEYVVVDAVAIQFSLRMADSLVCIFNNLGI